YSTRDNVKLITTKTCPKCIQAEKVLNDAGVSFTKIMAEDNSELIKSLKIMQAPTVVIGDKKLEGLGAIYHYINGGRTL
ncbi:MAG TPA: glutaredoxin family protein, partial [Gallicola sp.]|nr:glutaredoxin family protein [Gallicola sp.]